jgi:hypothetical protein
MSQSIITKPTGLPDLPSGVNDFVRKLFSVCNESVARQVSIFPFTHEEALDQLLISEFAKMQGPIELDSKWVIQIDAHYIGGGRHFRTWEVADIGLMVVFRNNGVIIRSKLVFLQSKKLFASAVKYRPIDPYFRQGMGRLLQTDVEHADLIKKRNLKFSTKSKYQALKAKADQADVMHSFAQRYGVELFYLLYNPYVLPWNIESPVRSLPIAVHNSVGCRVVPAKTLADGLATKQKGYAPSYQDVEGMFSGRQIALQANAGWRLEDFACDLFLACKVASG